MISFCLYLVKSEYDFVFGSSLMIIYYNFTFFLVSLIEGQNPIVSFAHFVLLVSAS